MAAVKVLTSKGYYSSTMDDIVAESQMSKGAIYHYYSSKKDVYLAVIDMWENQTQELLAPAANEDSSAKAIKKLFVMIDKLKDEGNDSLVEKINSFSNLISDSLVSISSKEKTNIDLLYQIILKQIDTSYNRTIEYMYK